MTVFTWSAGDGTSTADWTGPANWDQGVSYPQASDTAIFPAGKHKCYLNAPITCTTVTVAGDTADTVLELQAALTITGDLTITSGKMDTGADHALTVGGGTLIDTNGTLTLNGSTSIFTGTGASSWCLGIKGTLNGGTGTCTTNNFGTYANSNVVLPRTVNCTGNHAGYTFNTDQGLGTGSWDSNLSTVTITATTSKIRGAGTADAPFYNLIINTSGQTISAESGRPVAVTNDFTITAGTYSATSDLTVTEKTTIGDASHGSEDQATLTCNALAITLGSGKADGWAIEMLAGGTFAGGIANHTTGAIRQVVTNTKFTFTAATTTINSEYTTANRFFEMTAGKAYNADGRITLSDNVSSFIQWNGPSGDTGPHNLRLNDASIYVQPRSALIIEGYLQIDGGTFDTSYAGTSVALTVTDSIIIKDGGTLTSNASAVSLGNLYMQSGSTFSMSEGTTTVTNTGSNDSGRTWFTRTNSTDPGPRTLTVPSGSMLMFPNSATFEFDDSQYFYNITCSGTIESKNAQLHIDNDFRCNGWGSNGYKGYHFTVGNDFTKIGASTFNGIDTGSTWTVSGNMIIESGKIDVHGRLAPTPGDVNLKLYGNLINNGGYII